MQALTQQILRAQKEAFLSQTSLVQLLPPQPLLRPQGLLSRVHQAEGLPTPIPGILSLSEDSENVG